jgi:hypothetical protein
MSRGATWLARQAQYDGEEPTPQDPEPEPITPAATASLAEVAAAHDGQPLGPWLTMLYRRYSDLS